MQISNDLLIQFAQISAAIWIIVEAIRKVPGVKKLVEGIPGETVALFVSVVAILALIVTNQLPADLTTVIKVLAAGIAAQVTHGKVSAINKK